MGWGQDGNVVSGWDGGTFRKFNKTEVDGKHKHSIKLTTFTGGDAETRPINISVNFFIKIDNKNADVDKLDQEVTVIKSQMRFDEDSECNGEETSVTSVENIYLCLKLKIEKWEEGLYVFSAPAAMALVKKITRLKHTSANMMTEEQLSYVENLVDKYPTFIFR